MNWRRPFMRDCVRVYFMYWRRVFSLSAAVNASTS
jgi:hypothetical protein